MELEVKFKLLVLYKHGKRQQNSFFTESWMANRYSLDKVVTRKITAYAGN
jgi:hypothetical protein